MKQRIARPTEALPYIVLLACLLFGWNSAERLLIALALSEPLTLGAAFAFRRTAAQSADSRALGGTFFATQALILLCAGAICLLLPALRTRVPGLDFPRAWVGALGCLALRQLFCEWLRAMGRRRIAGVCDAMTAVLLFAGAAACQGSALEIRLCAAAGTSALISMVCCLIFARVSPAKPALPRPGDALYALAAAVPPVALGILANVLPAPGQGVGFCAAMALLALARSTFRRAPAETPPLNLLAALAAAVAAGLSPFLGDAGITVGALVCAACLMAYLLYAAPSVGLGLTAFLLCLAEILALAAGGTLSMPFPVAKWAAAIAALLSLLPLYPDLADCLRPFRAARIRRRAQGRAR